MPGDGQHQGPFLVRALRLDCPHCGLKAMSVGRKWVLTAFGWERPVACSTCGLKVQVLPFPVMLWTAPLMLACLIAAVLLPLRMMGIGVTVTVIGVLTVVAFSGLLFGIPLHKKGRTDPQAVANAHARIAGTPKF